MFLIYKNRDFNIVDVLFYYVDNYCHKDQDCLVDMSAVIPFKWDPMYVFDMDIYTGDIKNIVGIFHEWDWSGNKLYR